jgi:hypothetical protein
MPCPPTGCSAVNEMFETLTPRQLVKQILQGATPARPLLAPIVFCLGARIENLPLDAFLENPTKITNALRQIRPRFRSDGVTCYFNPLLEIEALGATRISVHKGELPRGLRLSEDPAKSPGAKVAVEVLRRMAATRRDGSLLIAAVSGPCTLAARLTQLIDEKNLRFHHLPADAFNLAAATITQLATALVEAGANLVFIQEDFLPALSDDAASSWSSLLAPVVNIIRFYESLPALQITSAAAFRLSSGPILTQSWDCVLCLPLEILQDQATAGRISTANTPIGVSLPAEAFQPQPSGAAASAAAPFHDIISLCGGTLIGQLNPVLFTTAGDSSVVPAAKSPVKPPEPNPNS